MLIGTKTFLLISLTLINLNIFNMEPSEEAIYKTALLRLEFFEELKLGQPESAELLFNDFLKVARDRDIGTALILCAQYNYIPILKMILTNKEKAVDINFIDTEGYTPLIWAASKGNFQAAQLLLDFGAAINAQNEHGNSALMLAAFRGYEEIIDLLLAQNAQVSLINNCGFTANLLAKSKGHLSIASKISNPQSPKNTALKKVKKQKPYEANNNSRYKLTSFIHNDYCN